MAESHADLVSPAASVAADCDARGSRAFSDLIATTKPGITRMVTITAVVGLALGVVYGALGSGLAPAMVLLQMVAAVIFGTALAAGGANAVNQWMEREPDACMTRTENRPLPAGRLSPLLVLTWGVSLAIVGCLLLLWLSGPAPALLAGICAVVYTAAYTPSKKYTSLSTLLGTIPGALPPMIGWSAATGGSWASLLGGASLGGWTLVALMTVWQVPHFLAIAWMYRDDYSRARFRVLSVADPQGRRTMPTIWWTTLLMLGVTLAPIATMPDLTGWLYGSIAVVSGAAVLWLALRLLGERTDGAARRVFFASIIHLPVLLLALVADAVFHLFVA